MLSCEQVEKFKLTNMEKKTSIQEQESFLAKEELSIEEEFEDDTTCGLGFVRGKWLQKLASKKTFLIVHALSGMIYSSSFYYWSGTLTTLEKQYKFSSAQMGYINAVYDVTATAVALVAPYYCSKGRFPRWMGFAMLCFVVSSIINVLPYFLFGASEEILSLTEEFGLNFNPNSTQELIHQIKMKELCYANKTMNDCTKEANDTTLSTALLFALSSAVAGIGGSIYYTLGTTYIDDNVKKSKAPMLFCISSFVRLLAPALGYNLASYFLKFFVEPDLHPKINDDDVRWIGAWWMGYIVFVIAMLVLTPVMCMFPKMLPRAALRKNKELMKKMKNSSENFEDEKSSETSLKDLLQAFKRLITNKTYFCNTMAGVFYCFGYVPFFFFQAKYIQIHFLFSASTANMITGTVTLVCAAVGLLSAGIVITIFKPRARYLAMWNIVSSIFSVFGIIAYGYFSCTASSNALIMENSQILSPCNENCNCDFVQFAPICGENNVTYISSCHAGCADEVTFENGTKIFTNCQCVNSTMDSGETFSGGSATTGACPIDCMPKFIMFFAFLCINKFIGGTEGTANFLLGMRCVEKRDKAISMGLTIAIVSIFAIVPSPTFFGWILDRSCLFWGKTCTKKGNCWLYDTDGMRYTLNMTAAGFVLIGTLWDIGTWYYSKDVKIFDENEDDEMELPEKDPLCLKDAEHLQELKLEKK